MSQRGGEDLRTLWADYDFQGQLYKYWRGDEQQEDPDSPVEGHRVLSECVSANDRSSHEMQVTCEVCTSAGLWTS